MCPPLPETQSLPGETSVRDVNTLPVVRQAVGNLLASSRAYQQLDPVRQKALAMAMIKVSHAAAELMKEEVDASQQAGLLETGKEKVQQFAHPMTAGDAFGGQAVRSVASTTRGVLNAISFPRFVCELINGVFKALTDSNQQQMESFVQLLNQVAASTEGFADANVGPGGARQWLVEQFPGNFELSEQPDKDDQSKSGKSSDLWGDSGWDEEDETSEITLLLRAGAEMPSEEALRTVLGVESNTPIPRGDPEELIPFVRRILAKNKQSMLATMIQMGMQRIVIESGKIHASMRFHVDARSAAESDKGSRFDVSHQSSVAGRYGVGPWGVSAKMTNTIGYVSTSTERTTEEISADVGLNSGVELNFRTDYLPLDRMAPQDRVNLIRANTLNPQAEAKAADQQRQARRQAWAESDKARHSELNKSLSPPKQPPPPTPPPLPKESPSSKKPAKETPSTSTAPKDNKAGSTKKTN